MELGLKPFNYRGGEVVEALCKFCDVFGREKEDQNPADTPAFGLLVSKKKQQKMRSKPKIFKAFRRDHIVDHMKSQHGSKWEAFTAIKDCDVKSKFFLLEAIERFLPSTDCIAFSVPEGIASLISPFFCNNANGSDGVVQVDADIGDVVTSDDFVETSDNDFVIHITDRDQFETVIRCITFGCSFRSIPKLFHTFGSVLRNMKLSTPSEGLVGRYVRFVVALNLSALRLALSKTWGFAVMADGATHQSEGYLDVRVSFGLKEKAPFRWGIYIRRASPRYHERHWGRNNFTAATDRSFNRWCCRYARTPPRIYDKDQSCRC